MSKKIYASLLHLSVSIFLVLSVLAIVVLLWYPRPYLDAMGAGKMLLILVCVDVSLGPLMTLIIFNPAKKSLKFDLAIIVFLQLTALTYGVNVVFTGRPVYLVYNIDRFTVVSAADITSIDSAKAHDQSLPLTGPEIVAASLPGNYKERNRILFSSMQGGPDLPQMPQFYVPYETFTNEVKAKILPLDVLIERQPKTKVKEALLVIANTLSTHSLPANAVGFIPMRAKARDFTVLVRRNDASIVAILPISPWSGN